MSATIIPLRRKADVQDAAPMYADAAQSVPLAALRLTLGLRREELLEVIEELRASPAAGQTDALGRVNADLDLAACRILVQIELMLRSIGTLDAVVQA